MTQKNTKKTLALINQAVRAARAALPIWEAQYPNDRRPHQAIEAAENMMADSVVYAAANAAFRAALDAAKDSAEAANAAHAAANAAYAYAASKSPYVAYLAEDYAISAIVFGGGK
jgi:hypothetical protein